ncbi:Monothiol glutaredoxin-S3 [Hibiscus syriacus]|uniref:Monothiol glutaredoxin-S3 n=1 Tax=Hibiscus syriacus TaxID=106335 RepID=A0A6A3BLB0_HIBSY|nr:glutaredoxin-C9-like [Hibiscus syriacus]KAE8716198.1 Monothiol glutaredoxin-S3 [Hibiscus syriacus]
MQQAIPYKSWPLPCMDTASRCAASTATGHSDNDDNNNNLAARPSSKEMLDIVSENAVIVFSRKGCCMSHVVRRLLLALGVNPAVFEIDETDESGVVNELGMVFDQGKHGKEGQTVQFPAVFIGGRLFGGLDRVMATHISGELVPVLKDAGALWL